MQPEVIPVATRCATIRAKVSNGSKLLTGVDGRSAAARRFRDLIAEMTAEAGGDATLSASERGEIRHAAALIMRLDQICASVVNESFNDNDSFIRLSGEVRRLQARMRRRNAAMPPPRIPLREQLAAEAGKGT